MIVAGILKKIIQFTISPKYHESERIKPVLMNENLLDYIGKKVNRALIFHINHAAYDLKMLEFMILAALQTIKKDTCVVVGLKSCHFNRKWNFIKTKFHIKAKNLGKEWFIFFVFVYVAFLFSLIKLANQIQNNFNWFKGFDKARFLHFRQNIDWRGETNNGRAF